MEQKEKYEKLAQELYDMSFEKLTNLNIHFDKRAEYVSQKIISVSRLLNRECENLTKKEEDMLLSKIHAATLNKAHKIEEKRHGIRKFVESK